MIAAIVCAVLGFAFSAFLTVSHQKEIREMRAAHEAAQLQDRALISELIMQVQVNAQGLPHYPQMGPFPAEPEREYLSDDTGLITYEIDPNDPDERDFADAASL